MASSSASVAAMPVPSTDLIMRDFTMVRNYAVLEDEISMPDAPPSRTVQEQPWLRDVYMSICHELNHQDKVISEMHLHREDLALTASGLCKAYNMLFQQPHLIFDQQADALVTAQRQDFLQFETASTQFAEDVRLAIKDFEMLAMASISKTHIHSLEGLGASGADGTLPNLLPIHRASWRLLEHAGANQLA